MKKLPKLSVNFRNHNPQDYHNNQYCGSVLNVGFTESQYSDKYLLDLPQKYSHTFTIGILTFDSWGCSNFSICIRPTRFRPVPSWHHLLFLIRFYCCVLFIYLLVSWEMSSVLVTKSAAIFFHRCIIDNLRAINWNFHIIQAFERT